jgi:hypothetical protein
MLAKLVQSYVICIERSRQSFAGLLDCFHQLNGQLAIHIGLAKPDKDMLSPLQKYFASSGLAVSVRGCHLG